MQAPQAVRKHDGRTVAFELPRLAASIARAAREGGGSPDGAAAEELAGELARAVADFLVREHSTIPSTAQVRELTGRLLRETGHEPAAEAYAGHARRAAALLWRLRVSQESGLEGAPWDRRRLAESLRAAGLAADPAGETARAVERKLVALDEPRVSSALVHALALDELSRRGWDARRYAARRVGVSFAAQSPRFLHLPGSPPADAPALAAFWHQAVHSPEVARAARQNLLSLAPYPSSPADFPAPPGWEGAGEPKTPAVREDGRVLWVRAAGAERASELAGVLAALAAPEAGGAEKKAEWRLVFNPPAAGRPPRPKRAAAAVSINAGGLLIREALRDSTRLSPRLAQLAALAALAHREREEYYGFSPVRGRELPVAVAGLFQAAAWLGGQGYERVEMNPAVLADAGALSAALYSALALLRQETGLHLVLWSRPPAAAADALWRADRDFLVRDRLALDPAGAGDSGLDLSAAVTFDQLRAQLDFLRGAAPLYDEPPALRLEAPLGAEADPAVWRELLGALQAAGAPRVRLMPGGSSRSLRLLAHLIRRHLEGYPLLEPAAEAGW